MAKTEPAADATAANTTALYAQLATWESEGPTSAKVIELTGPGESGGLNLDNYTFTNEVTVRGPVPSSPGVYAERWGGVSIDDSSNVTVAYINCNGVDMENSSNITVRDCEVKGSSPAVSVLYGIYIRSGCSDIQILDNAIKWFNKNIHNLGGCTDLTIRGNVFHEPYQDDVTMGAVTRMDFEYNWFSRTEVALSGTHTDWVQSKTNVAIVDANYVGNVGIVGTTASTPQRQAFFGNANETNTVYDGNIVITNAGQGIESDDDATTGWSTASIINNTLLRIEDSPWNLGSAPIISDENSGTSSNVSYDRNLQATIGVSGSGGSSGTNGERIDIGYPDGTPSGFGWDDSRAFDGYHTYFENTQSALSSFYDLRPKVGARTHWDHVNPLGATQTYKRVIEDGIHPANNNNAAAQYFIDQYDPSEQLPNSGGTPTIKDIGRAITLSISVS